jgi:hypothetical protein
LILAFSVATFLVVVFIAILLIRRHGHTVETAKIRLDIANSGIQTREEIAGMRQQWDAENQAIRADLKTVKTWTLRMLNRLGFLNEHEE